MSEEIVLLHPYDVEQSLSITRPERALWTKAGFLPVVDHEIRIKKNGDELDVPLYDPAAIAAIGQEQIAAWRAENNEAFSEQRIDITSIPPAPAAFSACRRGEFPCVLDAAINSWASTGDLYAANTMELAFFTLWLTFWQKRYRKKESVAADTKDAGKFTSRIHDLHQKVVIGLSVLANTPFAYVSVSVPDDPYKHHVDLCDVHQADFFTKRKDKECRSLLEYFISNRQTVEECSLCSIIRERRETIGYGIRVSMPMRGSDSISIFVKEPVGKSFLPPMSILPVEKMPKLFGWSEFGFSVGFAGDEATLVPIERALAGFDRALKALAAFSA